MSDEKPNPFNFIKHRGEPNKAEFEGVTITRQDKLFVPEMGMLVSCTPYDNHFVFEVPQSRRFRQVDVKDSSGKIVHRKGDRVERSEYFCTCGSAAVVTMPPGGEKGVFVCHFYHTQLADTGHGYHQTSIINKKDFENIAGTTIELPEDGKKWLI